MSLVSANTLDFVLPVMVFMTVALLLWVVLESGKRKAGILEKRLQALEPIVSEGSSEGIAPEAREQAELQKALSDLDEMRRRQGRFFLTRLLKNAGSENSVARHLMHSFGLGAGISTALIVLKFPVYTAGGLGLGLGLFLPLVYLNILIVRRKTAFTVALPGALDLIVRGIRAGLPLIECIKLAVEELPQPLANEFRKLINDLGMGLSIRDAIARFPERVPVQEARLFAIVITIQAQSGGNLSEVLTNLAEMLREKEKLKGKMRALTSEVRSSAWIIGSTPVLFILAINLLVPDFMQPLYDTTSGQLVLALCGIWMMLGIIVMRAMMRIEL